MPSLTATNMAADGKNTSKNSTSSKKSAGNSSRTTAARKAVSNGKKMGGGNGNGYQWTPHKRRGPIAAEFSGPGPAAIALPSLIGSK